LSRYEIQVAKVCGMFSRENDLSWSGIVPTRDHIRGNWSCVTRSRPHLLVVTGVVGRPVPYGPAARML